jgi:hypothetical protein
MKKRITFRRAAQIIAQEKMDCASVGPCASLVIRESDLTLHDDWNEEPARLSSDSAFRRQVRRWRRQTQQ